MGRVVAGSELERGFWGEWKFYVICRHCLLLEVKFLRVLIQKLFGLIACA